MGGFHNFKKQSGGCRIRKLLPDYPAHPCFFALMYTEVVSVYIEVVLLANEGIQHQVSKTSHTITHRLRVFDKWL
jgi:hypothetical protein